MKAIEIRAVLPDEGPHLTSIPLDQLDDESRARIEAYGLYEETEGGPQRWLADVTDLETAQAIEAALYLRGEVAGVVLDGEPCPERCHGDECVGGVHTMQLDDASETLRVLVELARGGLA